MAEERFQLPLGSIQLFASSVCKLSANFFKFNNIALRIADLLIDLTRFLPSRSVFKR